MNIALMKKEARETAKRLEDRLITAVNDNRDLTAEEEAEQAKDQAALDRQLANIERVERLSASVSRIGLDPQTAAVQATVPAVAKVHLSNDGFAHLAEFAQAVRMANPAAGAHFKMDERLAAPTNVQTEQGDAAGSYLVPAEFRQQITDLVFGEDDPVIDLLNLSPTSSNRVQGLGDETTPWGSSGVQAGWRTELDQMTASKAALVPRETPLNELYAFVLASEELLEDGPQIASLLTRKAAGAIRWKAAEGFMHGDGIAKPQGWFTSDALVTVAKETGQAADSLDPQNVAKMWSRMIDPQRAVWFANPDTLPQLMALKNGDTQLWFPDYRASPGGVLLGRPIYFSEHCPTIGDKGDLQFVNPNGYEAFKKQNGVTFADSIHLYFDYNVRAFRWLFRIGGQPVLSAPVTPPRSAATKSHFMAIADRA